MINRSVLVGRITDDPVLRKTSTGISVVQFTLAVNRRFAKESEQQADFINCVAWRGSADFMANYVKKGALLGVEGRIQTRNYKDQSDRTVYVTEVVCDIVQVLYQKREQSAEQPKAQTQTSYSGYGESAADSYFGSNTLDIASDDLPF